MDNKPTSPVIDPVCGMTVDPATAAERREWNGTTYYFCSALCGSRFQANPEEFVPKSGG